MYLTNSSANKLLFKKINITSKLCALNFHFLTNLLTFCISERQKDVEVLYKGVANELHRTKDLCDY